MTGASLWMPLGCVSGGGEQRSEKRIGVALVGLGYYSRDLLAPALQLTKHCYLAGIVTGSPEKIPVWQEKYNIPDNNVYNYENFDQLANNDAIDVIYVVLPNSMHAEYTIRAAKAGKHVWCEKPMAMNVKECESMIKACKENKRQLTIGYRMQHEPNTQTVIEYARTKPYGQIRELSAEAGFRGGFPDKSTWRTHKNMGGGAMFDMGVYSLNAARYSTQEEPIAVSARYEVGRPEIFDEVDETTYFDLEFKSGVKANCKTSFAHSWNHLKVDCEKGWYELKPMQSYTGVKGQTSDGILLNKPIENQQAKQMDDDALAIMNDEPPLVPGEEGLKDIRVVEAIFESAANESMRVEL